MPEEATGIKLAKHFANEENELEDVEAKAKDAEDKDREVVARLRSAIKHVEGLREVSTQLAREAGDDSIGTVKSEHMQALIENTKGTITEIEEAKQEVEEVWSELNTAESELEDVLEKAEVDREAVKKLSSE